jgi:flagellar biosynthetic protein FlhB
MAEQTGEKTEQPTQRRTEDALKKGQIPRSDEVQTVFVLMGALAALSFTGRETWQNLVTAMVSTLGHLHDTSVSCDTLQGYGITGTLFIIKCAGPVVLATALAGLLAGAIQNRFNTASEVLTPNWNRLNPVEGFKRVFSTKSWVPTGLAMAKLGFIIALSYSEIRNILSDPIFTTAVSVPRIAEFLAGAWVRIFFRIGLILAVIATADYGYQWWNNHQELMMTREELKEEMKNTEGNQQVKRARRRRRRGKKAKALEQVPKADVVVTNPTHIAIALRYDRQTMRAPQIVAKGIRLNAQAIRDLAHQHQVPIIENKPLARMLFKHGRVGGEIPAQFYAAVAEILAWVYRVNRYRYYTEANKV